MSKEEELLAKAAEVLKQYADEINKLPPPPTTILEPEVTCICGKKVVIDNLEIINTGVKRVLSDVCKGCEKGKKLDSETARVVCCKCGRVVCRLEPGTDPVDGFVVKAGTSLHLSSCSNCDPEAKEGVRKAYPIIEKLLWYKKKNRPVS